MIDKPIRQGELLKVLDQIHIGDTIKVNTGGNTFEYMRISGMYPYFLMLVNESGNRECMRWSEVIIKYRQGRILSR